MVLRFLKHDDAQSYFELSQNMGFKNFQISEYGRLSVGDDTLWIDKLVECHRRTGYGIVGVFTKDKGVLIGLGALKYLGEESSSPVVLIYRLSDHHWGQGYGAEVAATLTQHAFNTAKLEVLVAAVDPQNIVSKKIIAKLGMRF